jgi:hypothetical protein
MTLKGPLTNVSGTLLESEISIGPGWLHYWHDSPSLPFTRRVLYSVFGLIEALPIPAPLLHLVEVAQLGRGAGRRFLRETRGRASAYLLNPRNASMYVVSQSIPLARACLAEADAI